MAKTANKLTIYCIYVNGKGWRAFNGFTEKFEDAKIFQGDYKTMSTKTATELKIDDKKFSKLRNFHEANRDYFINWTFNWCLNQAINECWKCSTRHLFLLLNSQENAKRNAKEITELVPISGHKARPLKSRIIKKLLVSPSEFLRHKM